jgi:hypothetical protein
MTEEITANTILFQTDVLNERDAGAISTDDHDPAALDRTAENGEFLVGATSIDCPAKLAYHEEDVSLSNLLKAITRPDRHEARTFCAARIRTIPLARLRYAFAP